MHVADVRRPFRSQEFRLDASGNVDLRSIEAAAEVHVGRPDVYERVAEHGSQSVAGLDVPLYGRLAVVLSYAARNIVRRSRNSDCHVEFASRCRRRWRRGWFDFIFASVRAARPKDDDRHRG